MSNIKNNAENFDIGDITSGFNKVGNSVVNGFGDFGNIITSGFGDIGNFFKNIINFFKINFNMLLCLCFFILCIICCYMFYPILIPMMR